MDKDKTVFSIEKLIQFKICTEMWLCEDKICILKWTERQAQRGWATQIRQQWLPIAHHSMILKLSPPNFFTALHSLLHRLHIFVTLSLSHPNMSNPLNSLCRTRFKFNPPLVQIPKGNPLFLHHHHHHHHHHQRIISGSIQKAQGLHSFENSPTIQGTLILLIFRIL